MSDSEKMNALDFVISVLREHESALDSLIEKLEDALKRLPSAVEEAPSVEKAKPIVKSNVNITCEDWDEFKEASTGAEAVSFRLNNELRLKALLGNIIYNYEESIQRPMGIMGCGIPIKFQPNVEPSNIKRILSKELNVPENRIMRGDIQFPP
ncbi:MAG: hypothetical protein QXX08_02955 [Candidatus Bathyarchaeia archaeon]